MAKTSLPDAPVNGFTESYLLKILHPKYANGKKADPACSGLTAFVNRQGNMITFKCRINGKARILGHFTDKSDISMLLKARKERELLRVKSKANTIPDLEADASLTFGEACDQFYKEYVLKNLERPEKFNSLLNCHIIPALGRYPIQQVKPIHLSKLIRSISAVGKHGAAENVYTVLCRLDKFCIAHSYYETSLTWALDKTMLQAYSLERTRTIDFDTQRGEPDFSNNEMKQILTALENDPRLSLQAKHGLRLLMLTPCRTGELLAAKWEHYNAKTGELFIPKESRVKVRNANDKKGGSWIIPLSEQAQQLMQELKKDSPSNWILGLGKRKIGATVKPDKQPGSKFLRQVLKRLQGKINPNGAPLIDLNGAEHINPHDFRRTFTSHSKWAGYDKAIANRCMNHAPGKVEKTYDHDKLLAERREALQKWADYVDFHISDPVENVVKIHG